MNTTITYTSLNALVPWPAVLAQQLEHWRSLATITAAEVILEPPSGANRAFRVKVRLEVAGRGLQADVRDPTLESALLKATQELEIKLQAHKSPPPGPAESLRSHP